MLAIFLSSVAQETSAKNDIKKKLLFSNEFSDYVLYLNMVYHSKSIN